jgi:hypothetical protein
VRVDVNVPIALPTAMSEGKTAEQIQEMHAELQQVQRDAKLIASEDLLRGPVLTLPEAQAPSPGTSIIIAYEVISRTEPPHR